MKDIETQAREEFEKWLNAKNKSLLQWLKDWCWDSYLAGYMKGVEREKKLNDCIGLQQVQIEKLREKEKKLRDCVEQCFYLTVMRDPQMNTHAEACDVVQKITRQCLQELGD